MPMSIHYPDPDDTNHETRFVASADTVNVADNRIKLEDTYFKAGMAVWISAPRNNMPGRVPQVPGGLAEGTLYYLDTPVGREFPLHNGPKGTVVPISSIGYGQLRVICGFIPVSVGAGTAGSPYVVEFKLAARPPFLYMNYLMNGGETGLTLTFLSKNDVAGADFETLVVSESGFSPASLPLVGQTDVLRKFRIYLNSPTTGPLVAENDSRIKVRIVVGGTQANGTLLLQMVPNTPNARTPHALL